MEEIRDRDEAATIFEHPRDRISDLAVTASADVAFGTYAEQHDLSGLHGACVRTAGRYEQRVPLIINRPVSGPLAARHRANVLRSRDVHDLVLNNTHGR